MLNAINIVHPVARSHSGRKLIHKSFHRGPVLQDAASLLVSWAVGLLRHREAAYNHASKEDALFGASES